MSTAISGPSITTSTSGRGHLDIPAIWRREKRRREEGGEGEGGLAYRKGVREMADHHEENQLDNRCCHGRHE